MVHDGTVRADAQRNLGTILAAARDVIAERGLRVPMTVIAERAGVAVGTLYRHFPTKDALVAGVVADSVGRLAALIAGALAAARAEPRTAGDQLYGVLDEVAGVYADERAFKEAVGLTGPEHLAEAVNAADGSAAEAWRDVGSLLALAQEEGAVRSDVSPSDLLQLVTAVPGPDAGPRARTLYLDVLRRGLTP